MIFDASNERFETSNGKFDASKIVSDASNGRFDASKKVFQVKPWLFQR
jgi:hypothetical protein